jgi:hypothetical protein
MRSLILIALMLTLILVGCMTSTRYLPVVEVKVDLARSNDEELNKLIDRYARENGYEVTRDMRVNDTRPRWPALLKGIKGNEVDLTVDRSRPLDGRGDTASATFYCRASKANWRDQVARLRLLLEEIAPGNTSLENEMPAHCQDPVSVTRSLLQVFGIT